MKCLCENNVGFSTLGYLFQTSSPQTQANAIQYNEEILSQIGLNNEKI